MDIQRTSFIPINNNTKPESDTKPQDNEFQKELGRDALNQGDLLGRSIVQNNQNKLEKLAKMVKETPEKFEAIGVLDIAKQQPEKIVKIVDSGLIIFLNNENMDFDYFETLSLNSDFSPQFYSDLELVKQNKSIVPEFSEINEASNNTKVGDVAEVKGKMYINDGEKLIPWKMSKEKYLELFPPVLRFATKQGQLGDCYLVSSLANSMRNPIARVNLYKSFEQNDNDVTVTIKGLEEYGGSYTFKNSEVKLNESGKHLKGAKGLQMYEEAYKYLALRAGDDTKPTKPTFEMDSEELADRIKSGQAHIVMSEIHGLENISLAPQNKVVGLNLEEIKRQDYTRGLPTTLSKQTCLMRNVPDTKLEDCLKLYANNDNYCINFATKTNNERVINEEYDLIRNHAYSIIGYDPDSRTVTINNPHNCCMDINIPIDELKKHTAKIYLTALK